MGELSDYEKVLQFERQGDYDKAITFYQLALGNCEKALANIGIATLRVANRLARIRRKEISHYR